jgi:glycosyltransferase involved in cell wall biosynthesis
MNIDIVIPTFNRAHTIARAIDSVLSQSYEQWKLWIIDDGSTDQTEEVVGPYVEAQPHRVSYHKLENRGVSAARNYGVAQGIADWVAFLDSDDEWLAHKLKSQVEFLQENHSVPLIHGEEIWIRRGRRVNPMKKHQKAGGDIFERCLKLCLISPSAAMMKRSTFENWGGFREDFVVCEDYDLWLKVTHESPVGFIERPLIVKYGGHEDQLSSRFHSMDYYRVKSMYSIRDLIHDQRRDSLDEEIIRKSEILLKGYRKHQNFIHYSEIEGVLADVQS